MRDIAMSRPHTGGTLTIALAVVGLLGVFALYLTSPETGRRVVGWNVGDDASSGAVGTSGTSRAAESRNVIRELETITGTIDGYELVGRRVDLDVRVQQPVSDRSFWVGPKDNRLLVVVRPESAADAGQVVNGQQTTISGTIERLPPAATVDSWGLSAADHAELLDRRIYLRAETVTAVQTATLTP
jgi:hypothetical protein